MGELGSADAEASLLKMQALSALAILQAQGRVTKQTYDTVRAELDTAFDVVEAPSLPLILAGSKPRSPNVHLLAINICEEPAQSIVKSSPASVDKSSVVPNQDPLLPPSLNWEASVQRQQNGRSILDMPIAGELKPSVCGVSDGDPWGFLQWMKEEKSTKKNGQEVTESGRRVYTADSLLNMRHKTAHDATMIVKKIRQAAIPTRAESSASAPVSTRSHNDKTCGTAPHMVTPSRAPNAVPDRPRSVTQSASAHEKVEAAVNATTTPSTTRINTTPTTPPSTTKTSGSRLRKSPAYMTLPSHHDGRRIVCPWWANRDFTCLIPHCPFLHRDSANYNTSSSGSSSSGNNGNDSPAGCGGSEQQHHHQLEEEEEVLRQPLICPLWVGAFVDDDGKPRWCPWQPGQCEYAHAHCVHGQWAHRMPRRLGPDGLPVQAGRRPVVKAASGVVAPREANRRDNGGGGGGGGGRGGAVAAVRGSGASSAGGYAPGDVSADYEQMLRAATNITRRGALYDGESGLIDRCSEETPGT